MVVGTHGIPDELLELILLRVASPTCLVRSASVCKQWLAIVSNPGFLRRFQSVHGSAAAAGGVYKDERWLRDSTVPNVDPYLPKFVPSQQPSATAIDGRCFSLDFLPESGTRPWIWKIQDSRGSLLLLDKQGGHYRFGLPFRDMIVCEPATRRYHRIAPRAAFPEYAIECAFLADGGEEGGNGCLLSNCRLVFLLTSDYVHGHRCWYHAAVVMPGGGLWREVRIGQQRMRFMGLTKACVYWHAGGRTVVFLDRITAEISSFALPDIAAWDRFAAAGTMAVAAGCDDEPRIVTAGAGGNLNFFARLQGEWSLEKSVPLSAAICSLTVCDQWLFRSRRFTFAHNEGKLLLVVHAGTVLPCLYRLDVETVELESVHDYGMAYPCKLPWPPALHACTQHDNIAT